jgi:ABC-2 type transport system ATP-binding protein
MIEIQNIHKVVEGKTLLDVESLSVEAGEIAAVIGPVDSGKDILFEILIGRTRPTAGSVRMNRVDPAEDMKKLSQTIGVMFADDNLYQRQSPRANLKTFCQLYHLPASRVDEVLEEVGLLDRAGIIVEKLSSSLMRRLSLGRALLHQPQILLLMSPFKGCDETSILLMSRLLKRWVDKNTTILIIAEEETGFYDLCSTIHLLDKGRITRSFHPTEEQDSEMPFMIPVRLEGRVALIDPAEILFVSAQDDRAVIQTFQEQLRTQFTVKELEDRLSRRGFFRAHRSYLVNLQHVKEVIPFTRDSFSLRLKDDAGTLIPLSRSASRELREILGF